MFIQNLHYQWLKKLKKLISIHSKTLKLGNVTNHV